MKIPDISWLVEYAPQLERLSRLIGNIDYNRLAQYVRQLIPPTRRVSYLRRALSLRDEFQDAFERDLSTAFVASALSVAIRQSRTPIQSLLDLYTHLDLHSDLVSVAGSLFASMSWADLPEHDLRLLIMAGLTTDDIRQLVQDAEARFKRRQQSGLRSDINLLSQADESLNRAEDALRLLKETEKNWKRMESGLVVPKEVRAERRRAKRIAVDKLGKLLAGTIQLGADLGLGIGIWPGLLDAGPTAATVLSGVLWSATSGIINVTQAISELLRNNLSTN